MTSGADRDRLAILVHEVRSPVAALAAVAEAYREAETVARRSLVTLAVAACTGIDRLLADTKAYSVVREPVDVARLIEASVAAMTLQGAGVRSVVESGLPSMDADPHRLRQAIDNLISNALTHAPSGEDVVVAARAGDGVLVVSVTDSGPGIPAEEQGRIFEAGVRLDPNRPGSGLGLAVVQEIAEAHGGTLDVESSPGRGSTFMLVLPLD
jgi:signal transduction histidine kinase